MGKDSIREKDTVMASGASRRSGRPVSASPYSENYRPQIDLCQRHLINHRLLVSKLTRRELEDKYLSLCDENYSIKKRFHDQEEQIKRLKTKLMRLSSESTNRSKSRLDLNSSEHYSRLHDLELQRRELHEKLEALRRATSSDGRRSVSGNKPSGTRTTRQIAPNQRRSKSAHPVKDTEVGRCREYKSSTPSNDGYDEEDERQCRRLVAGKTRTSTDDRTDDEEENHAATHRNGHRKSYGADDEGDNDEDDNEEDAEAEDEDRDVLSGESDDIHAGGRESASVGVTGGGKERHTRSARSKDSHRHCPDCERHRTEQLTLETDLVKMKLNIKYLHKELQNEKEKSALLARQLEEKLSYEIMKRNAAENLEILNLNRQVEDLAKELQRQVDEQKRSVEQEARKQGNLEAQIRKEKDKNTSLFEECERLKKNIEKLKENLSEVEIERDFLKRQQENFSKIVDENKLLKYQLDELRKHNEDLLKQIDSLKEEELVTKESQRELLEKLKTLQQDNDTLSVMLEGLRTENEMLAEERVQLEQSLKSLEASPIRESRPMSPRLELVHAAVQTVNDGLEEPRTDDNGSTKDIIRKSKMHLQRSEPPKTSVQMSTSLAGILAESNELNGKDMVRKTKTPHEQLVVHEEAVADDGQDMRRPSHVLVKDPVNEDAARMDSESHVKVRHMSIAVQMSRERHAVETAEAAQQLVRHVSINQMIPKLSQIMNSGAEESTRPNNVELLIANSYPATLEVIYDQLEFVAGNTAMKANYERFFEIHRVPSMWHKFADNAIPSASPSTSTTPAHSIATPSPKSDVLTIEIRSVRWHKFAVERLLAAKISLYYVEFEFLDLHGHRMETPCSDKFLAADGSLRLSHTFKFRVSVELDDERHRERQEQLRTMLRPDGNDAVRFVVVNENEGKACDTIGYATVRLRNALQNAASGQSAALILDTPIYDFEGNHDEIGVLQIVLEDIKLLQSFAGSQ
ncbi:trichohyalin-like [Anopheles nili]|uniref:trichohyalin-like n=1 Tax=Anopheles nili TaxID=185578 RepID=UPI00237A17A8|nr:trichohyalin-like [Anopheles nili]